MFFTAVGMRWHERARENSEHKEKDCSAAEPRRTDGGRDASEQPNARMEITAVSGYSRKAKKRGRSNGRPKRMQWRYTHVIHRTSGR